MLENEAELNTREYQTVILAAFLHDIGKILMRGDFGPGLEIKGQHPQISANFVSAFKELFAEVADIDLLQKLVQRHHEDRQHFPSELLVQGLEDDHEGTLAALVSKADNLSSSERGESSQQWQDYKATPLMSVLERVNHDSDKHLRLRYHPRPLSSTDHLDVIFPAEFAEYAADELNHHLREFGKDFVRLFRPDDMSTVAVDKGDFDTLLSHLVNLIYRYTWCVPSNTQETVPDVSLFDHLKTTAAIATCLYRYHQDTGSLSEKELSGSKKPRFCLAVGDLSGIQNYIFDIAHLGVGGVARRLRARSLYVQLCSDIAAHIILHRLKLPMVNMIMNSGGKFYLLLPNLPATQAVLHEVQEHADRWLLADLNGELALNLAYTTFDEEGFKAGSGGESGFGSVMRMVSERLDQRKQNCFGEATRVEGLWKEDAFVLGSPFEGRSPCRSCRKFAATERAPGSAEEDLCVHCHRDVITGSRLPKTRYIAFYRDPDSGAIPCLGYSASLESEGTGLRAKPYLVMSINDVDMSELTRYPAMTKYLARHIPIFGDCHRSKTEHDTGVKPGDPATFECIAHRSEGAELLGFLKADVDRLGETFVFGLKRPDTAIDSISRITTMSRMFDLFFSGWIERLVSGTEFRDCYTVFSGGDDLFIVGPWNTVPHLAERIRHDLDRFTGNSDGITISAGILLGKPRLPISSAGGAVEELLRLSKRGRNAVTLLGHTISWEEWDAVRQEWANLAGLTSRKGEISSAFLHGLLRYAEMWQLYKAYVDSAGREGDVLGLRYQPLLAYNIARNLDATSKSEIRRWAEALLQLRPGDEKQRIILDNLGLIASLLIYGRRGGTQ